jgi:hypothetical protein
MRHLTDELLQQYLDKREPVNRAEVEAHITICHFCKEKLEQYRELYFELSSDDVPAKDLNFNSDVLSAIKRVKAGGKSNTVILWLSTLSGTALALFGLTYFEMISWSALITGVWDLITVISSPIQEVSFLLIDRLNGNLDILVFAAVALALFQLLDYGLVKQKVERA